ncbi:AI-2E family transporter [Peptoniphilus stercorisuis]|uniref:Sporulation integral membrane protein YtvI n=1 Tax=Peptoniphilus stercorisuis TaxID=1436965 RepID=A0ABS4KC17_9FIRM|nr:AI-2E family transporter [Peptoniphilus stercorisuis]MBP2025318.1 sporulation integral membrane protein YtvI [Peptoniphilus stercorisuis]
MNPIKNVAPEISSITPKFIVVAAATLSVILLFLVIYYLINIGNRYIEKNKRIGIDLKRVIKVFSGIIVIYILSIIFKKYSIVGDTVWALFVGMILAFAINPLVNRLEQKNIKRQYGVLIVYLSILIVMVILLVIVIPKTIQEISNLLSVIPSMVEKLGTEFSDFSKSISKSFNLPGSEPNGDLIRKLQTSLESSIDVIQAQAITKLKSVASGMYVVFSKVLRFILVIIFSFYFTVDKEKFKNKVKRNLPEKYKEDILYVSGRINQALLDFVKGRLLMALFVGFATMVYLLVLRVDFAIVIGMITCVADIIPYIGPFMGFLPAVLFAFMDSPMKALWVAILFVVLQWAENNVIAPKLLGDKTGLNPILILISIIIGGGMFGVLGMILAVPTVSVLIILLDFAKMKYNERNSNISSIR